MHKYNQETQRAIEAARKDGARRMRESREDGELWIKQGRPGRWEDFQAQRALERGSQHVGAFRKMPKKTRDKPYARPNFKPPTEKVMMDSSQPHPHHAKDMGTFAWIIPQYF